MSAKPVSVLISCGSNVDPQDNLRASVEQLAGACELRAVSQIFATRPVGGAPMPDFLNAAVEIVTYRSAAELKFGTLREIEWLLGRRRSRNRSAPRPIDLDLSLFGDEVIENEPLGLAIPDPEILTRPHVALPLADIAPHRRHPLSDEALSTIAARLLTTAPPGTVRPAERLERWWSGERNL